jgi:hypothetical protein
MVRILLVLTISFVASFGSSALASTCVGANPCHACHTCEYCKRCSKMGGTCGVCKGGRGNHAHSVKPQIKRTSK